jgi:hypothetical protein
MVKATSRQADNTSQIESSVDRVSGMAQRIFDEMEQRRNGSLQVIEDLRRLKEKTA